MQAYRLKSNGLEPEGTVAFRYPGYDYGLARDDTEITGRQHISLTKHQYGAGPSFTAAVDDLEEIEVPHLPTVDEQHAHNVCKIGQDAECCKFLTVGANGFSCEKLSKLRDQIESRSDMVSKGDNCEGRRPA